MLTANDHALYWYKPKNDRDRWPVLINQQEFEDIRTKRSKKRKITVVYVSFATNWDWDGTKRDPPYELWDAVDLTVKQFKTQIKLYYLNFIKL